MGTEADTIVVQDTPEPVQQQQGETAGGVKPFVCDLCKSSYTRLDHLARHFRGRMVAPVPFSYVCCCLFGHLSTL